MLKCFPFLRQCYKTKQNAGMIEAPPPAPPSPASDGGEGTSSSATGSEQREAKKFSFRELAAVTMNFADSNYLGEGGFGKVYKGCLRNGELVAVKLLNLQGVQGKREFITEMLLLVVVNHPNLVNLIGYCSEGDQRLIVYEYMMQGSLEDHIHDLRRGREPMGWQMRVKVAIGAARGLAYLHHVMHPCVIHRDMKSGNILLDEDFNAKVSDFGIAKFGPVGENTHVSTRVMGTYGYCAPDYAMTGRLTTKSDVYSFGVVLLELITGRKAYDMSLPTRENVLVTWAMAFLKNGRYEKIVDPRLRGQYPRGGMRGLTYAAMAMVRENPRHRPTMQEVVASLELLSTAESGAEASSSSAYRRGRISE